MKRPSLYSSPERDAVDLGIGPGWSSRHDPTHDNPKTSMAPDRGSSATPIRSRYQAIVQDDEPSYSSTSTDDERETPSKPQNDGEQARDFLAERANSDYNFTFRAVVVGSCIGIIICFSNTYFGLQTGWVSSMAMPSALIGYAYFKTVSRYIAFPFTPVENVLVQTVAGAVGTMPLGSGFVGVIPALNYLLKSSEGGPLSPSLWRLIVWSVGLCFFGVFVAVPLRKEVILREKLKFPSGTATALMIGVLHGEKESAQGRDDPLDIIRTRSSDNPRPSRVSLERTEADEHDRRGDWKEKIRLLVIAFVVSAIYTLTSYFIPQLRDIPLFGKSLALNWLWTLNPSPAYVGQGIIMGGATTTHMLIGAIIGWGILSPIAKHQGWAPGPVNDWQTGSRGWIVWISLAIMLADSVVNLTWLAIRPLVHLTLRKYPQIQRGWSRQGIFSARGNYLPLEESDGPSNDHGMAFISNSQPLKLIPSPSEPEPDALPEHLVSNRVSYTGFFLAVLLCVGAVHISFPDIIPLWATILAVAFSLLLSIMGVRALGETDLNPVSGISKLTQLVFALVSPQSAPHNKHVITINLLAGAISESAALQAGDMMQDLKTGHLLGASPKAQFYGQLIGSFIGAVASALVYKLYISVYEIPNDLFQIPTAYVWIFTARLVTGQGLPEMAWTCAAIAGLIWCMLTVVRIMGRETNWQAYVPGGIAVAVGMYNVPSFTLARAVGGLISTYWVQWRKQEETPVVVLASGLILGEGVISIVNLVLTSLKVPHI